MHLQVVGCWSPYPAPGSACSAYLVYSGQDVLLLDCGHGAMAQLFTYINPDRLTAIIISHSHPDHYNDLAALRHYWRSRRFLGHPLPTLPVWFPPGDTESERWQQTAEFEVRSSLEKAQLGSLKLEFFPGSHALPTSMVRVTYGNKSLFYTGDTSYSAQGVAASQGCDLLIAECTLPPEEGHMSGQLGHLTWEECGQWAVEAGCPNLLATHFWPEYNREEIARVVAKIYPGKLWMAHPGLIVEV